MVPPNTDNQFHPHRVILEERRPASLHLPPPAWPSRDVRPLLRPGPASAGPGGSPAPCVPRRRGGATQATPFVHGLSALRGGETTASSPGRRALRFKVRGDVRTMESQDKVLVCRDCGKEFLFSAGEQAFYAEKGFQNEPTRCRNCRAARKGGPTSGESGPPRTLFGAVCSETIRTLRLRSCAFGSSTRCARNLPICWNSCTAARKR